MPQKPPHTVAETPTYLRKAERLLTEAERQEVVLLVATDPTAGDLIQGTGGVRKLRFGGAHRGKRGAFRVIYFHHSARLPIYLLTIFAKNERADLTQQERNALRQLTAQLAAALGDSHE